MRSAIDTNILSALLGGEPLAVRIADFLDEGRAEGGLVISPVVYVEIRGRAGATEAFVGEFLESLRISVDWVLERDVWQLAGGRFGQYAQRRRQQGSGEPKRLAADFVVAAHAVVRADRLVTLDQRRYRADFPELDLVEL